MALYEISVLHKTKVTSIHQFITVCARDYLTPFATLAVLSALMFLLQGVDVYLKSDGSGAGIGGAAQKDVMPPLMPGLKARQNKQQ